MAPTESGERTLNKLLNLRNVPGWSCKTESYNTLDGGLEGLHPSWCPFKEIWQSEQGDSYDGF